MNTDYTIKNFRVFDQNGTDIDIRPITILTGCNNSGKSSITKSLCLLKEFHRQIEDDFNDNNKLKLGNYRIDFHKHPNDILGSFKHVLHKGKDQNLDNDKYITFQIVVDSRILQQYVKLELTFTAIDEDELDNAYLHKYTIYDLNDNLIFTASYKGDSHWDYSSVKKAILYYLYGQYTSAELQNEISLSAAYSCNPNQDKCDYFNRSIKEIYKKRGGNELVHILEWQFSGGHRYGEDGSASYIKPLIKYPEEFEYFKNINLGIFCYYPILDILKDETKETFKSKIRDFLEEKKQVLDDLNNRLLDLLFLSFENSEFNTFIEFVNDFENKQLFQGKGFVFSNVDFSRPWDSLGRMNQTIFDNSNLPADANWEVYLLVMDALNKVYTGNKYSLVNFDDINERHYYIIENALSNILNMVNEDILVQILPGELYYTGTSTAQLKRMYSLEDDSDFEKTLRSYFEIKRLLNKVKPRLIPHTIKEQEKYKPCTFTNHWIKAFKLGDRADICSHADGYGVTIRIFESPEDKYGMLLSEKGYGATQIFAILLKVENAIMKSQYNDLYYHYDNWSLGESLKQILRPYSVLHPLTIALEEPENHLHPSLQSMLADMISDAFANYGVHFLIETHSEYVIRKLQLLTSKKKINSESISILYVNAVDRPQYIPQITNIGITEDGMLKNEFGTGFFDESLKLSKKLFNPIDDVKDEE